MKTRMIALFLTLAMVVSISPAVVADDTIPRPTVDEILNEYHQKAFEAEAVGEASTATYSPRTGTPEKTLEQETVDNLNDAGYEAYNVTAENYEALETQLKTDFADMGLDPDGSYIIAISGEESKDSSASGINPRAMVPVEPDHGCGGSFTHTYNGTTYTMRNITVTSTDDPNYAKATSIDLLSHYGENFFSNFADTYISIFLDMVCTTIDVGTFLSLMGLSTEPDYFVRNGTLTFHAGATWHRKFTQVWQSYTESWLNGSSVEYVNMISYCDGLVLNTDTGDFVQVTKNKFQDTRYSNYYNDIAKQRDDAALGYITYTRRDIVGDVEFYFGDSKVITLSGNIP